MESPGNIDTVHSSIYVISLQHRTDRHAHIEQQLAGAPFCYSFQARAAARQRGAKHGIACFPWKIESTNIWWNRHLKIGEVDCFLAHLECWEDAATKRQFAYHVFFEDDAVLPKHGLRHILDSVDRLSCAVSDWDLLYLGREPLEPDHGSFGEFTLPGYSYCTFAYALSTTGVSKLLRYDPRSTVMPIDEFLPATYLTHPRTDVSAVIRPTLRAYATMEVIVTEAAKAQFGSDTEDSPDVCEEANYEMLQRGVPCATNPSD